MDFILRIIPLDLLRMLRNGFSMISSSVQSCLLHCLRHADTACGAMIGGMAIGGGAANANGVVAQAPGLRGAATRVVPWALARAVGLLDYAARRPVRFGGEDEPGATPDERVVLNIVAALSRGDRMGAERAAEWLVRPAHRDALLRALEPIADAVKNSNAR